MGGNLPAFPPHRLPTPPYIMAESTHDFPSTQYMWIRDHLDGGEEAQGRLVQWAMNVYAKPLQRYASATGLAHSSQLESDELVNGFLASVLSRQDYLKDWIGSGLRLRQWFRNGLHFHAKTMRRDVGRIKGLDEKEAEALAVPDDADRLLDHAWATAIVEQVCDEVRRDLREAGKASHWDIFWQHHIEGVPYAQLVAYHAGAMTEAQAASRAFEVASRLRERLSRLIMQDGAPSSEVSAELRGLMESIRP